jgi:hypothetical protein
MINYLIELTFLLYGGLLIYQSQYVTCLILLVLSLVLITKGIKYKNSIIIAVVVLLFITQYHRFFKVKTDTDTKNEDVNEGFKTMAEKKQDIRIKKSEKNAKIRRKKLVKETSKFYTNFPKTYNKNKEKINKRSKNWGDALNKWSLLKENFFIILNSEK